MPTLVSRYLAASLELNPTTIYSGNGAAALVSMILTELTGVDITSDTLQVGIAPIATPGQTPILPGLWFTPDTSQQLSASQRLIGLQVGYGGTTSPSTGTYMGWVLDTVGESVQAVPCLNQTINVVDDDAVQLILSGGAPSDTFSAIFTGGTP